jgi:hypothetical protein
MLRASRFFQGVIGKNPAKKNKEGGAGQSEELLRNNHGFPSRFVTAYYAVFVIKKRVYFGQLAYPRQGNVVTAFTAKNEALQDILFNRAFYESCFLSFPR